jgi:hypothetical protein
VYSSLQLPPAGNLTQRTSTAAHVCTPNNGVNYDLCAANGTTITTYGWLSLSLNLGLYRNFTWRIVVADVTQPLIGVDFLSHFGLLVDCRNNCLLDGVTSLSSPAQPANSLIPSVKIISSGRPMCIYCDGC